MLRATISIEEKQLIAVSEKIRVPYKKCDSGYLVHTFLSNKLKENAPNTFFVESKVGRLFYASCIFDCNSILYLPTENVSPYPPCEPEKGQRWRFNIFAAPIKRKSRSRKEVDPYEEQPEGRIRQDVYLQWLQNRIPKGVILREVVLERWTKLHVLRRTQGKRRQPKLLPLTGAHFEGVLEVDAVEVFLKMLRRGLGRHRAFGFGMIRLGENPC